MNLNVMYIPEQDAYMCSDDFSQEYGVGDTVQEAIVDWINELDAFERVLGWRDSSELGKSLREELHDVQSFLYPDRKAL